MKITELQEPVLNFTTFSAGETVKYSSGYIDIDTSENRLHADSYDKLFDTALYALKIPTEKILSVVLALPYGWHDGNSEAVANRLSSDHRIQTKDTELDYTVCVQTERQGILALVNMAFGWQSGANEDILKNSILHDCGGMTTEHVQIINRRDTDFSDSDENLGQWRIARRLKEYLTERYHVRNVSEFDCLKYIENKEYHSQQTDSIDLTEFLHKENQALATDIVAAGRHHIRKYDETRRKYLTGGKAKDLFPYMSRLVKGLIISKDPLFDNAFGALKTAMNLTKNGAIPVGLDIGNQNTKAAALVNGTVQYVSFTSAISNRTTGRVYA
ncbi:hypothetical protein GF380_01100 [Candidatus Uhrbacteria bacterium]|nr:hypothetical protein [Candidatus Uhrbacteria bacterium]